MPNYGKKLLKRTSNIRSKVGENKLHRDTSHTKSSWNFWEE